MARHSLQRLTLFLFLLLISAGFISGNSVAVMAQATPTEGSLKVVDSQGKTAGECPLKHTEVRAEISGLLSRVTVTQQFENTFPDKIEAVYVFPLPHEAAVDDMTILVGNRTVKGQIMKRADAQATYQAARARGQVAALLDQQRPNIFTQSVANILPGQQIKVIISYVETLKYEEGSYEWSFPMVVGPRYTPVATDASPDAAPDASLINPPAAEPEMRAGHDISIEVTLDAGVPLIKSHSDTHEIEVLQPDYRRAVVRLKDQTTIPNKDFVLKYDVAGQQVEDAMLAHRSDRGGFFTLILQPPGRVTAEDVMPKELVFVLDTSGSMEGFPLDKAKEAMALALGNLYPHDTFNVITFSGDTHILFSEPVAATPENLRKAKKFLASRKSEGGTEMMKAIRAALDPSDAQDHVRIACFMTDGQVGNDMEILSQVQKHPNARVFAMGFGSSPNRFLLDKMAEYGRGEVEYVAETSDGSAAARRFHERVRNPLLTDVSVEWGGLQVTDVYPKMIPDLFSAKPVILSGRYAVGGKGVIRLKGKMSGREFVKEIPVELPEIESQHDVLATLWARRKVDDLMGQDMGGLQTGRMRDDLRQAITQLGLDFRMMTQFTSFVAVEDSIITGGGEPRRVDVPVDSSASYAGSGGPQGVVMVTSNAATVNVTSASVSSSVETRTIQELPLTGRSFQSLLILTPGTVSGGAGQPIVSAPINISVNGQRPYSNRFMVDGVDANFGIAPGGQSPGASAGGGVPALTATGATNPIASAGATEEVAVHSYYSEAEYGRGPGSQVSIITRSGTNEFHGSLFHYFGHEALDANDWFANSRGLAKPRHRSNDFGGTFGGPLKRDHVFFFASYEGLRLRHPVVALTDVPSLSARSAAPANIAPLFNLYPLPNGPTRPDGFAESAAGFTNAGRHDAVSLRLDHRVTEVLSLSGRYSYTGSAADERGAGGFALNTLNQIFSRAQTLGGSATYMLSPHAVAEVRANYSRMSVGSLLTLDDFGGATLPPDSVFSQSSLLLQNGSFSADLNGRSTILMAGNRVASTQRQLNTLGSITIMAGVNQFKFGAYYRRMSPIIGLRQHERNILFDGVTQALTGNAARSGSFARSGSQSPVFNNFSIYGQDQARLTAKLTLTFGLRWEVSPAPASRGETDVLSVTQVNDPALLSLAPSGTRLWKTTFGNFAPRVGLAYQLPGDNEFVIRGGFGVHYDISNSAAGDVFADSYPFLAGGSVSNVPFSFTASPATNSTFPINVPFSAIDPHLRLPYTLEWDLTLQRAFGSSNLSAAYVGTAGRRQLLTQTLFNPNQRFVFVRLTDNGASSSYHSLQVQFNRRLSSRLGGMVSYTWAKSLDNSSPDTAVRVLLRSNAPQLERGPSDFDIRHTLAGFVSYQVPEVLQAGFGNALLRHWELNTVFNVRSAAPLNVVYSIPTGYGLAYLRPNLVTGIPLYLNDAAAAGGRRINPAAFSVPQDLRQGTLGRNALRGFSLSQVNLAVRRQFSLADEVGLVVSMEATNVFNHPNFGTPMGNGASLGAIFDPGTPLHHNAMFGQSFSMGGRSPGGTAGSSFGPSYYPGGARTIQLALKLKF